MKLAWLRRRKVLIWILAGVMLALLAGILPTRAWFTGVTDWLKSLGFWATPAFIVIYVLTTVLGLPNIILVFVAGTLFGLLNGILSVSVADTLGAAACYGLGRTIARKRIKQWMERSPGFAQLDRAIAEKGWKILLFSRLSPVIPSNVLNYGFSCTKVNFWHYLFFTWLGMLPVIGLYVYLGYFGVNLVAGSSKPEVLTLQAGGLMATLTAAVYTTRLAKSALAPPEPLEQADSEETDSEETDPEAR